MGRCERLTQRAGVEGLGRLVRHPLNADVPGPVRLPRLLHDLRNLVRVGVHLHLDLVEDPAELLMILRVEDPAEVPEPEPPLHGRLADAEPRDVALTDVHHALRVVDQVMDLAL